MNQHDSEFEARLATLRPTAPAPALEKAIARELAVPPARVPTAAMLPRRQPWLRFFRAIGWAGAGACAALVAIVLLERAEPPAGAPTAAAASEGAAGLEYAESSAEILAAEDEGIVYGSDAALARQVRYSSIERHVWTDDRSGARLEIEIPREDVRLVPVALQ